MKRLIKKKAKKKVLKTQGPIFQQNLTQAPIMQKPVYQMPSQPMQMPASLLEGPGGCGDGSVFQVPISCCSGEVLVEDDSNIDEELGKAKKIKPLLTVNFKSKTHSMRKGNPSTRYSIELKDSLLMYERKRLLCGQDQGTSRFTRAIQQGDQKKLLKWVSENAAEKMGLVKGADRKTRLRDYTRYDVVMNGEGLDVKMEDVLIKAGEIPEVFDSLVEKFKGFE